MKPTLILGDRAYSSWSLRGWLLFHRWGIACDLQHISFRDQSVAQQLAAHWPARTVPTLLTDDGAVVSDSLAIAEELATRHPGAGIWPTDPAARATARALAAEMHSGFGALRDACPMNLRVAYADSPLTDAVAADMRRLSDIWANALDRFGGPWLAGDYSAADAFFAPVAARVATYALPVTGAAADYVARHLADPAFRRWRAMARVAGPDLPWYARDHAVTAWPGPQPQAAAVVDGTTSVNAACPYSGKPVTHVLEMGGRRWGFCNAFCRDKTIADPEAWPQFTEMVAAAGRAPPDPT